MAQLTGTPLQTYGFFANGNFHTSGHDVVINSVWDHSPVAIVDHADDDAALTAVQDAVLAFNETRKLTSFQRASVLRKIARGIANRKEVVAVRWLRTLVLQPIGLAN